MRSRFIRVASEIHCFILPNAWAVNSLTESKRMILVLSRKGMEMCVPGENQGPSYYTHPSRTINFCNWITEVQRKFRFS